MTSAESAALAGAHGIWAVNVDPDSDDPNRAVIYAGRNRSGFANYPVM
jgi:hypothetical protein